MPGPLRGLRVVEVNAIGPVPMAATLLADMGADVVRIVRATPVDLGLPDRIAPRFDILTRGRPTLSLDLKTETGRTAVLDLIGNADALLEGFRPGVMERLGLGPDVCLKANPRLVYGRMTGFGQTGPLAPLAGHDLNYIALSGALHAIGPADGPPVPPLALVGDFGGGAMFLAFGILAALWERQRSGKGQIVDAAMCEGASYMMGLYQVLAQQGLWRDRRASNMLDGGAPYYACYETADGRYVAVAAIEPQFYGALLQGLGLARDELPGQHDQSRWPELRDRFASVFRTRSRDDWATHFAAYDACVTPVLAIAEVDKHPHAVTRRTYVERDGVVQPAPHPLFARTPGEAAAPAAAGTTTLAEVLSRWSGSQPTS